MRDERGRSRRGRLSKSRGKSEERRVAKLLTEELNETFTRNPDNGTKVADIESETYVVEVKSRLTESFALLRQAWGQAEAAEAETGKHPLIVLTFKEDGRRVNWLVQRLGD